jgi:hypothetical protein
MHPIAFIKSLTLGSGAMVVGALSAMVALGTHWLKPPLLRWVALLAVPFLLAYALYWSPVWFGGGDRAQYAVWAPVCIGPWTLAGLVASVVVAGYLRRRFQEPPSPKE